MSMIHVDVYVMHVCTMFLYSYVHMCVCVYVCLSVCLSPSVPPSLRPSVRPSLFVRMHGCICMYVRIGFVSGPMVFARVQFKCGIQGRSRAAPFCRPVSCPEQGIQKGLARGTCMWTAWHYCARTECSSAGPPARCSMSKPRHTNLRLDFLGLSNVIDELARPGTVQVLLLIV